MANFTTATPKTMNRTIRRGVRWLLERNLYVDDVEFPVAGYSFRQEFRASSSPESQLLEVASIEIPDDESNAVQASLTADETLAMVAGRHARWHQFFIRGERTDYEWVLLEEGWIRVI